MQVLHLITRHIRAYNCDSDTTLLHCPPQTTLECKVSFLVEVLVHTITIYDIRWLINKVYICGEQAKARHYKFIKHDFKWGITACLCHATHAAVHFSRYNMGRTLTIPDISLITPSLVRSSRELGLTRTFSATLPKQLFVSKPSEECIHRLLMHSGTCTLTCSLDARPYYLNYKLRMASWASW